MVQVNSLYIFSMSIHITYWLEIDLAEACLYIKLRVTTFNTKQHRIQQRLGIST